VCISGVTGATGPTGPTGIGVTGSNRGAAGVTGASNGGCEPLHREQIDTGLVKAFAARAKQQGANAHPLGGGRDSLQKPTPLQPEFAKFPAELKSLPNWVLWRYLPPHAKGGKWRKVPFQPKGKTASTTDRSTWSGFEESCAAYTHGGFDGVGFVFDGEIGADGLCYCGIDFGACVIDDTNIDSLARERIKRLNTYTERSVSGTGFHCIVRAEPLDRIVKCDGVEIYTNARFFTFTGCSFGEIKPAATEVRGLVDEVRTKEAAAKPQQQLDRSDSGGVSGWFEALPSRLKDEVVDHALGAIAKNTRLLELEADGGNNADYYKLTVSVARSGAPQAEDIFVKHASSAKNADTNEALRQHFSRCRESQPFGNQQITVGTLLHFAQQHGANFDQWKCPTPCVPALPPVTWSAAELRVSFSNIPHRQWLYGTYLIRGEITVVAAPGGVGKTALATGIAIEIAGGTELLSEKIWGSNLKVLSINGEDGATEIARRMWAFSLAHAHQIAGQSLDRLYVAGADDARVQRLSFLRTTERNVSVLDRNGFDVLEFALDTLHPDVLILDPLVAFCGGGNMNDNAVMSLVMRELKRLAAKFDCAVLIVHHTKKGGDQGDAEAVLGAATIVNLARRAIMPVPMTKDEATTFGVLPSQRFRYFKVVDAKSNLAPRSADSPWYGLHSVELPNAESPYPHGDNVQAVARVTLPFIKTASAAADDEKLQ
jgi:AAA domain